MPSIKSCLASSLSMFVWNGPGGKAVLCTVCQQTVCNYYIYVRLITLSIMVTSSVTCVQLLLHLLVIFGRWMEGCSPDWPNEQHELISCWRWFDPVDIIFLLLFFIDCYPVQFIWSLDFPVGISQEQQGIKRKGRMLAHVQFVSHPMNLSLPGFKPWLVRFW